MVPRAVLTKVLPNLPLPQFHGTVLLMRASGRVSSAIRLVLATRVKLLVAGRLEFVSQQTVTVRYYIST
jgi:hypothetical protein